MFLSLGDCLFALGWFVAGLFVFQTRGKSKKFLYVVGFFVSIFSFVWLVLSKAAFFTIMGFVVMNKITGIFTDGFYYIGANISRGEVMGKWSSRRIAFNALIIIILWLLLSWVSPYILEIFK